MSSIQTYAHPFKQGIMNLLGQHFASEILKRFKLSFEAEIYRKDASPHIWRQIKDDNLVMEVHFDTGHSIEYICDVYSWETRKKTEAHLLRYITDCVKSGKFGQNWEQNSLGRISEAITSGKFETPYEFDAKKAKPANIVTPSLNPKNTIIENKPKIGGESH